MSELGMFILIILAIMSAFVAGVIEHEERQKAEQEHFFAKLERQRTEEIREEILFLVADFPVPFGVIVESPADEQDTDPLDPLKWLENYELEPMSSPDEVAPVSPSLVDEQPLGSTDADGELPRKSKQPPWANPY